MKRQVKICANLFYQFATLCALVCPCKSGWSQTRVTSGSNSVLQERYSAAQHFQAANDLVHAAEQYRIFLADTLGEIASGRANAGEYDKAKDDFDEALQLVPDFPMMQLEYAHAAMNSGDFERSATLARSLVQKYPKSAQIQSKAHAILGEAFLKTDKSAEAKKEFEAAVSLDASFDNGYELAVANLNLGDATAARKIFAEMLSSFGDTATLHMYFGQAYGNSDFQLDAVAEFQKAIAEDAHLRGVHYSLAVAYLATSGESKLSNAESELREEISVSPTDAPSYAALGHLLATNGQSATDQVQAETYLKRATELDHTNPDGFLYLGQFYAQQKRILEAESALQQSISLTRDVSRNAFQVQKAHYLLARLLVQQGNKTEADKEIAISQALMNQNLSRDQSQLADFLGENRQPDSNSEFKQPMRATHDPRLDDIKSKDVVEAFELRVKPAVADSYNNLGAIAASMDRYDIAVGYFQRAFEWEPSIPGLDFNWGRAAFAAADYPQAIGPLSRYLRSHPNEDGARRVLGLSEFMLKDYGAARTTLAELASRPSEPSKVKFAYADSLLKTGDLSSATVLLESLQQTARELPQVQSALAEAYTTLGRQQLAEGDAKGAIANLKKATNLDPHNSELRRSLEDATRTRNHN